MPRKKKMLTQVPPEFLEDLKTYIADVQSSVKALTRLVNLATRSSAPRLKKNGGFRRPPPRG